MLPCFHSSKLPLPCTKMCNSFYTKPQSDNSAMALESFLSNLMMEKTISTDLACSSTPPTRHSQHCSLRTDPHGGHLSPPRPTKASAVQEFRDFKRKQRNYSPPPPPYRTYSPPPLSSRTERRRRQWQQGSHQKDTAILVPKRSSSPLRVTPRDVMEGDDSPTISTLASSKHVRFAPVRIVSRDQ